MKDESNYAKHMPRLIDTCIRLVERVGKLEKDMFELKNEVSKNKFEMKIVGGNMFSNEDKKTKKSVHKAQ